VEGGRRGFWERGGDERIGVVRLSLRAEVGVSRKERLESEEDKVPE